MRIVGSRSPLGTRRTCPDVNIDAIPVLPFGTFDNRGPDQVAIIGDAPKSYVVFRNDDRNAYIAKAPRREGPIECVTEYLIARIGTLLPLRVAEGRLVRLGTDTDVRFMSRQFLDRAAGEQLVHGSQLVGRCFGLDERAVFKEVKRGHEWSFYTVELVDDVLKSATFSDSDTHERLRAGFARMLTFDALIGANDRHAQNWGIIESAREVRPPRFAPLFDTARALFWNHTDAKLHMWERERTNRIAAYAMRSRPLIGATGAAQAPNHFDAMEHMLLRNPSYRIAVQQIVRAFVPSRVTRLLHDEFRRLLSRRRLEFIDELLRFRHARLQRICDLS